MTALLIVSPVLRRPSLILPDRLVGRLRVRLAPAVAAPFAGADIREKPLGRVPAA